MVPNLFRLVPFAAVIECSSDLLNVMCGVAFPATKPGIFSGEVFLADGTSRRKVFAIGHGWGR